MKTLLTSLLALMVAMPLAAAAGRYAPATRRMHVGKEFEQFESIYLYDNDARFYDVLTMRFFSPDQLASLYPSTSSYVYCLNNPVSRVDINGMNDYEINEKGEITLKKITNDKTDTIYGKSRFDGSNTESSITIGKGLLASRNDMVLNSTEIDKNGNEKKVKEFTTMFCGSASDSIEFFEFVAANSDVEWSNVLYEDDWGMKGVVGTSYKEPNNLTLEYCIIKLGEAGFNVIEADHSHGGKYASSVVSPADVEMFKKHYEKIPNLKMNIFVIQGEKMRYKPFNQDSIGGELEEVPVTAPAKKR